MSGFDPLLKLKNEAQCHLCRKAFVFRWRHHCHRCGHSVCVPCSDRKLIWDGLTRPMRVCDACVHGLTRRHESVASSHVWQIGSMRVEHSTVESDVVWSSNLGVVDPGTKVNIELTDGTSLNLTVPKAGGEGGKSEYTEVVTSSLHQSSLLARFDLQPVGQGPPSSLLRKIAIAFVAFAVTGEIEMRIVFMAFVFLAIVHALELAGLPVAAIGAVLFCFFLLTYRFAARHQFGSGSDMPHSCTVTLKAVLNEQKAETLAVRKRTLTSMDGKCVDMKILRPPKDYVNFSGSFELDRSRSDSMVPLLDALGVPWVARKVMATSSNSKVITHDGCAWIESTTTAIITKTQNLRLDKTTQEEINPIDRSIVEMTSHFTKDGKCVVSENIYKKLGHRQTIQRWLEDDGNTYHVKNELRKADGEALCAHSYFNRTAPR